MKEFAEKAGEPLRFGIKEGKYRGVPHGARIFQDPKCDQ